MGNRRLDFRTQNQVAGGLTASGQPRALAVEDDGSLKVSGSGGGGGDATAANQTAQISEAEDTNAKLIELLESVELLLGYQFARWGTAMRFTGGYADINAYGFKAITDVTIDSITLAPGSDIAGNWVGKTIFAGDQVILDIVSIAIVGDAQFFLHPPTP